MLSRCCCGGIKMTEREEQNDELAMSLWERFTAQETLLSLDGLEIKTNAFEFNKEWNISVLVEYPYVRLGTKDSNGKRFRPDVHEIKALWKDYLKQEGY